MSDPLAAPPMPDRGEDDADPLYLGVGKIMSGWETIEFELSLLYAVFVGDQAGEAMREYGEKPIPRYRIEALASASEIFFRRHPSQETEGRLALYLGRLRTLLDRRNEVAHGIVFNVERITIFTERFSKSALGKPQFLLIAPYYAFKQHGDDGLPAYGYTCPTLAVLLAAMATVYEDFNEFRKSLPL